MLQTLRKSASGLVAKILMGLLIISFGIWGIADVFRGFGSQTLATIGSTEVTVPEFRQLYQQRLQQISQQIKRGITPEQARAIGIPDQVLNERLGEAALDDRAKRLGLALSDAEMAERIQSNPSFRGPSGTFDPNYFNQLLRSNGYTEQRFVEAERRLALRQQLIQSLGGGIELPQTVRDAFARYETEERSISYVTVDPPAPDTIAAPTEEQLRSFFDARKVAFRAPEYRKISVLALTPETLAGSIAISDADLKAAYDANPGRFGTPEKRVVQQIVFPNAEDANAAAARLSAGTPFADIVTDRKLTPNDINLGEVTKNQIFDPAVANAAFGLPQGSTSGVVQGRFGPVIVHVESIVAGTTAPFEQVAPTLRTELQNEQARRLMLEKHDQIEDERAGGAKLSEIAAKLSLKVEALDTDAQGKTPDGAAIPQIPARADVLRGAFASDVGVENDQITLPQGGGYVWFDVDAVTPARDRSFDEAKALVLDRWKQDEAAKALDARVAELQKKVEAGEPFDKVVTDAGLELRTARGIRRGRAADGVPQGAVAAVFDTKVGSVGTASTDVGDSRILFRVDSASQPASTGEDSQLFDQVRQRMEQDLMTEYLVRLQSDLGVRINRAALDQIVGGGDAVN
ncbi:peptidylprolyl isomerase [Bosea sp. 117]|uniref:peptidylprolyl isomerase n=1 Tax=Bosea sp. 117 TaxID=1125973 RepID=UPI000494B8E9|nr:peptidylprolyl isomerase [Bosea sp. 117]